MRTIAEIMTEIAAEAQQDSCGEFRDPATFDPYRNTWHNNAQRDHLYELAMELAAAHLAGVTS